MYACVCVCELPVDTPSTFSFSPSLFLLSRYTSELRENRDDNRQGNWTMEIMSKVRVQTGKGGRRTTRGRIAFPLLLFLSMSISSSPAVICFRSAVPFTAAPRIVVTNLFGYDMVQGLGLN